MNIYPMDRPDPAPGKDISSMTLEACQADSRQCGFCGGAGFATIFNPHYDGRVVEWDESDMIKGPQRILMRSTAYCICTLGRKIMVMHQTGARDVYARTPDLHDVLSERCPQWTTDDPTERDLTPEQQSVLPPNFRRLLAERMRVS